MSPYASTTNGNTHRAAVITPGRVHYGDGSAAELRPGVADDLGAILAGTLGRFAQHSTIVVDGPPLAMVSPRSGWRTDPVGPWMLHTLMQGAVERTVAVGFRDAMNVRHFGPLFGADTDPGVVAMMLDRYSRVTGYAWRGTFSMTALHAIRLTWGNGAGEPRWRSPRIGRLQGAGVLNWRRPLTELERSWGYVHTFDAMRAYLTAAAGAELAWSELEHTGPRAFDARVPGYWRLRLGEVTRAGLADPLRPPILTNVDDGCAWMTTPMAQLVMELDPACRVLDSHTGRPHKHHPAGVALLRPWAVELRDAFGRVAELGGGDELRGPLRDAVKRTYKDAIGGMQRVGGRVYRADWAHTVIDWWRAWMYRRVLAVKETQGCWPVRVKTDSLAYADGVDAPQARGATRPYATLTDELRVWGCEVGCGCSRPSPAAVAGFTHEATTTVEEWST